MGQQGSPGPPGGPVRNTISLKLSCGNNRLHLTSAMSDAVWELFGFMGCTVLVHILYVLWTDL